jgi:DNA-binding beta-propeller fold protein YncE
MKTRTWITALTVSALVAACGGSGAHGDKHKPRPHVVTVAAAKPSALPTPPPAPPPPEQALVTAETENRLLVVELPSGRVVRRIPLPPDPEDVAAGAPLGDHGTLAVVSSPAARQVTLLEGATLRPVKTFGGFAAPHIIELWPAPNGYDAYVTDDARGTLSVIDVIHRRVVSTIHVGADAHHMGLDYIHQTAWVALGESASTVVILSTANVAHPRVTARFDPGFEVHDLAVEEVGDDAPRLWVTASDRRDVTVFDGIDQQVLFRVPVGPPPQHVALTERYAYLTSGYGSTIEQVDVRTGRILHRARTPYGSFELAADSRYVVTSSLLRGTLAIFTPQLKLLRVVHLAPATREVALSLPAGSQP